MENPDECKKTSCVCSYCNKRFSKPCHLYAHVRTVHQVEPKLKQKLTLVCPCCFQRFHAYSELRDHLTTNHEIGILKEETQFKNFSDFQVWKESKEKKMKCFYVKTSGVKVSGKANKAYYVCHRSKKQGRYSLTSQTNQKKMTKSQGFAKLTVTCPSTLEVISEQTQFKAILFTPHVGHTCSLAHINLTKTERIQIAGKIAEGVSFNKILDDVRDGLYSEESLGRLSILDRQDLRNITRDFSLRGHLQLHQNDVISVRLWIERMKRMEDESPVLFYKPQGTSDDAQMFSEDDFVLILMNKFQLKQLLSYRSDKICIDSTHGTTNYDFLLTTLLVVDNFSEGIPTAFLLSNKADTQVLTHFFQIIKMQAGDIKCKAFMSDDAPEFYNAWTRVMSVPDNHLLCTWHVDKNWRKNLSKIKGGPEIKTKVYKTLRILLQIQDIDEFRQLLEFVISELMCCEDTVVYGEYFKTHYALRPELWAYCFRKGLGINTNMFLEAIHRSIKYIYFEGKKNRRVDMCLYALFKLVRDIMFKKLKRNVKGTNSYHMNLIKRSHLQSKCINAQDICRNENSWTVQSTHKNNDQYVVQKNLEECFKTNNNCHLVCNDCQICVHEFTCTCTDFCIKFNLCKHIHAVIQHDFQPVVVSRESGSEEATAEIVEDLVNQNCSRQDLLVGNEDLKVQVDVIYELLSSNSLTIKKKAKVKKMLNNVIDLVSNDGTLLKPTSNEPANKKVAKQLRFKSTKKKRTPNSIDSLKKPNATEIELFLGECDKKVKENDHLYAKNIGIF